jgi:isocitrate dehydrogenase (NAD+)
MNNYIDTAVEQFRTLITEQLARQEKMEKGANKKDFATAQKIIIGVCGGDGIGPIIVNEARRVLEKLLKDEIASGKI